MTISVPDSALERNGWFRDENGNVRWKQSGWLVSCPRKVVVGGRRVQCSRRIEHPGACT